MPLKFEFIFWRWVKEMHQKRRVKTAVCQNKHFCQKRAKNTNVFICRSRAFELHSFTIFCSCFLLLLHLSRRPINHEVKKFHAHTFLLYSLAVILKIKANVVKLYWNILICLFNWGLRHTRNICFQNFVDTSGVKT